MFTTSFGFIVDYLAQVLKLMRFQDFSDIWRNYFELDQTLSTRDKEGITKIFSGLLKILYPNREAPKEDVEQLLVFAMEGRKRVKTEIYKIDRTFDPVEFSYTDKETGEKKRVYTNEEKRYPRFFQKKEFEEEEPDVGNGAPETAQKQQQPSEKQPEPVHYTVAENQTGISYYTLFADYLKGAKKIEVVDPYIRRVWQIRNFIEFLQVVIAVKEEGEEVDVHLITDNGEVSTAELQQHFNSIEDSLLNHDINFTYEFASKKHYHARSITTDTGWKISLDRGFDIFQRFDTGVLSIESVSQEARFCKAFEITYIRID
jgi:ATP-dependent Lon protease